VSSPEHEPLAAAVATQIEAVVAAAEQAANEFRRQVETSAKEQADRTRQAAEADARRIRQEAASWAAEYLADSKRIIDEFTADRVSRISTLTDDLIQGAESIQRRFSEAQNVRRQLYELISSLGAVAEASALEAQVAVPALPPVSDPDDEVSGEESTDTPGAQSGA
jgi:cell division septum initiation protein DivIVA